MDLYVLAGGDVEPATGIFIGYITDAQELGGGHLPIGQFDPHHLYPGLALAIDPTGQAQAPEFVLVQFSFLELPDLALQGDDVLFDDRVLYYGSKTFHYPIFPIFLID